MSTTVSTRGSEQHAPTPRFVPAIVSGAAVQIECFDWCTVDHVADPNGLLADIWHGGEYTHLHAPHMGSSDDMIAWARLGIDPSSSTPEHRRPFVMVSQGDEDKLQTPDQADAFADNLEAFAARIREMAQIARGGAQ
ncbi:DUF6907 domain-containing protein [Streptomyces lateritius]|uniref:DUF6907 domain-containing protein n=1 Tax=Streptomyces lateritius TaxID=67313 RepID=UPI001C8CD7EA|nr:hypothetical protein [Streptomyces lateritius]MBX9425454.1 hypothetical protein [Streptomyces lateritius]